MTAVRRVAIIGAECVGKTELAQQLARSLPGVWIPEYLREFCDRVQRTPLPPEQAVILAEQRRREVEAIARARAQQLDWVLADSAPLVTAAYSELLFEDRSLHGPAVREAFHSLLMQHLQEAGLPFALIAGSGDRRLQAASAALRDL